MVFLKDIINMNQFKTVYQAPNISLAYAIYNILKKRGDAHDWESDDLVGISDIENPNDNELIFYCVNKPVQVESHIISSNTKDVVVTIEYLYDPKVVFKDEHIKPHVTITFTRSYHISVEPIDGEDNIFNVLSINNISSITNKRVFNHNYKSLLGS